MPSRKFFIIIGVFLVVTLFVGSALQQRAVLLTSPILHVGRGFAGIIATPIRLLQGIGQLRNDINNLHNEVVRLRAEVATLEIAKRENELLREQLGAPSREKFDNNILASVIGRDPIGEEFTAIIDAGKRDGIYEGAPVVAPGGALIGRIDGVGDISSIVQLISHPKSRIDIRVLPANIRGAVQARAGFLSVDVLPQRFAFKENQTIVTTGADGLYPAGLYLGTLGKVLSEETDVFERRRLNNDQILETLTEVFILVQNTQ